MLVLSRKPGEGILLDGGRIKVKILAIEKGHVKVGFDAPREVHIRRAELPPNATPGAGPAHPSGLAPGGGAHA